LARKILITGASGLLGLALTLEARGRGLEVIALYHSTVIEVPGVQCIRLDLLDKSAVEDCVRSLHPELIVHAAAEVRVDWCEDHPAEAERINVGATEDLARLASEMGARFLYVSTDSVYDGKSESYRETDTARQVNVYAATKFRGEAAAQRLCQGAIVARVNFYGCSGRHKSNLIGWILGELKQGKPLPGFMDVIFCPLSVNDAAQVLLDLLNSNVSGVFNVVGKEAISKYEFARRVAAVFGFDPGLVRATSLAERPLRAARPLNMTLDVSKIEDVLGRTLPDVATGLAEFADRIRNGYEAELEGYFTAAKR